MGGCTRNCPEGCSYSAKMKTLRRHVDKVHNAAPYKCDSCSEPFLLEKAFSQHNRDSHSGLATVTCKGTDCFTTGQSQPSSGPFECVHCGREFDVKKKLNRHKKRHNKARPRAGGRSLGITVSSTTSGWNFTASESAYSLPARSYPTATTSMSNLENVDASNLDSFIANTIQPNEAYLRSCSSAVDRLVTFLQHNAPAPLRPSRVIKGGSLGKGTAVKGKSDIDLTVMLAEYDSVRDIKSDMPKLLTLLESHLKEFDGVRVVGLSRHSVQVEMKCHLGEKHSVDILPAVDVTAQKSLGQVYSAMQGRDRDIKDFYSASLAPVQRDMYSELPTKLKSLIRLVKYWKKNYVEGDHIPTSYLFELIVLDSWIKAGRPESFDTSRAFRDVLSEMSNHRNFKIYLPGFSKYTRSEAQINHNTYIMDPVNPTNDVYNSRNWDWDTVSRVAREWLETASMFHGLGHHTTHVW